MRAGKGRFPANERIRPRFAVKDGAAVAGGSEQRWGRVLKLCTLCTPSGVRSKRLKGERVAVRRRVANPATRRPGRSHLSTRLKLLCSSSKLYLSNSYAIRLPWPHRETQSRSFVVGRLGFFAPSKRARGLGPLYATRPAGNGYRRSLQELGCPRTAGPKASEAVRAVQSVRAASDCHRSRMECAEQATTSSLQALLVQTCTSTPKPSKKVKRDLSTPPAPSPRTRQWQSDQARDLLQQASEIVRLVGDLETVKPGGQKSAFGGVKASRGRTSSKPASKHSFR